MNIYEKFSRGLGNISNYVGNILQKISQTLDEGRRIFFENLFYQLEKNLFDVGLLDIAPNEPESKKQIGIVRKGLIWGISFLLSTVSIPSSLLYFTISSFANNILLGIQSTLNNQFLWGDTSNPLEMPKKNREWLGFILSLIAGVPIGFILGVMALVFVRIPYHNFISFLLAFDKKDDERKIYEQILGAPGLVLGKTFEFIFNCLNSSSIRFLEVLSLFHDKDQLAQLLEENEGRIAKALSFLLIYPLAFVFRAVIDLILVGPFLGIIDGFSDAPRELSTLQKLTRGLTYGLFFSFSYLFDGLVVKGFERALLMMSKSFDWIWNPEIENTQEIQSSFGKSILSYPLGWPLGAAASLATVITFGSLRVLSGLAQGVWNGLIDANTFVYEKQKSIFRLDIKKNIEKYSSYMSYVPTLMITTVLLGSWIVVYDNFKAIWNGAIEIITYPSVQDVQSSKIKYLTNWSENYTKYPGFLMGMGIGFPYSILVAVGNFLKHSAISSYYGAHDGYAFAQGTEPNGTNDTRNEKAKNYGTLGYYLGAGLGYMYYTLPQFFKEYSSLGYQAALQQFRDEAFTAPNLEEGFRTQLGYVIAYPLGFTLGLVVASTMNSYDGFAYMISNASRLAFYAYPNNTVLSDAPGRYISGSLGYALGLIFGLPSFALSLVGRIALGNFEMFKTSYIGAQRYINQNTSDVYQVITNSYSAFDIFFAIPSIVLGSATSFTVISAQYSAQDFAKWFSWLSTRSITELVTVDYQAPHWMGAPGLVLAFGLGIPALTLVTGLRWGIYDPIVGLAKGMQSVFFNKNDIQLHQLQYVSYYIGGFLAYQVQEGFYQMLKVMRLAVDDIFTGKIQHEENYKGSLGLALGLVLGAGLGVLIYTLRFMTYDLILGATAGWNYAYSKFKEFEPGDNLRSLGAQFWKQAFFGIGLILMANFYGFLKLVPEGFNAVWDTQWSFFKESDPTVSGWYFYSVFTLMAGMVLGSLLTACLASLNFVIRTAYESLRGLIAASMGSAPDEKLTGFFNFVYRFNYSIADYAIVSFKLLLTGPHLDKDTPPKLPNPENTNALGALVGIILGFAPGVVISAIKMSFRVISESLQTCTESFNIIASLGFYHNDQRTHTAQYLYGGLGLIPGALAAIGVGVLMGVSVCTYALFRAVSMTRGRFDGLDEKDEQVQKLKNLYATVDNWDRKLDVDVIKQLNLRPLHHGGKGVNCFWSKVTQFDATPSASETLLDKLVEKRRDGKLTKEAVEELFKQQKELTTQKDDVVNYLFN